MRRRLLLRRILVGNLVDFGGMLERLGIRAFGHFSKAFALRCTWIPIVSIALGASSVFYLVCGFRDGSFYWDRIFLGSSVPARTGCDSGYKIEIIYSLTI